MTVRSRLERWALAGAMTLPDPVQRALAGRRVVVDGNTLATDLQLMLRMQRLARLPGAEEVPVDVGRRVLRRTTSYTCGRQPIGSVRPLRVAGLPARLYVPGSAREPGALLVYFHGGGFWCGDLDTHDGACRFLAEQSYVRVLAVDYRLAPEHPFPAAYDDALAAFAWTADHARELGADPARVGVGGDSAGGCLAAGVAIEATRQGLPCAVQLLVYPVTQARRETRSLGLFGERFYLTRSFLERGDEAYAGGVPSDDPRLSPLVAELPAGLAPALLYTAGFDPLRDEGEAYGDRLRAAGVPLVRTRFADQIHGFFNVVGIGTSSRAANFRIARELGAALAG